MLSNQKFCYGAKDQVKRPKRKLNLLVLIQHFHNRSNWLAGFHPPADLEWVRKLCGLWRHRSLRFCLQPKQVRGNMFGKSSMLIVYHLFLPRLLGAPYQWELLGRYTDSDLLEEQFLKRKSILCWEGCLLKDYFVPSSICEGIERTVDRSSSCSLGKTQTRENGENLSFTNIRPKYVHHCTL